MKVVMLGKQVGNLRSDGVFVAYRTPEHFFRKFQGFGLSWSLIDLLMKHGCSKVVIIYDKATHIEKYSAPLWRFIDKGKKWTDKEHDEQRILPLIDFDKEEYDRLQ